MCTYVCVRFSSFFPLSLPIHQIIGEDTTANELAADLKDVWHRWYEIGVALRIPTHELDTICLGNDPVNDCFEVVVLPFVLYYNDFIL